MSSNRLLARLSRADLRLLEPHLQAVDLPVRRLLVGRNRRIEHVYFPESGVVSVVANGEHSIEIGIIGREGMSSVSVILGGNEKSPHETYVQIAGRGQRISANNLRAAIEASATLHRELLKYANSFLIQTTQTALANGRHKIEERLARWLLMAHDRLDGDQVPLTHEFLGVMIGTSRPGVTIALQELERRGWLTHRRGMVSIIDRDGLVRASNGAYVAPNDGGER
jgi:CRP-like cAMP-binding protein